MCFLKFVKYRIEISTLLQIMLTIVFYCVHHIRVFIPGERKYSDVPSPLKYQPTKAAEKKEILNDDKFGRKSEETEESVEDYYPGM